MIDSRVLEANPESGITEIMHFDDVSGDFTIQTQHDNEFVTEGAKALYADVDERARHRDGLEHVGWIPLPILFEIRRKYESYEERQKALADFLNDPAWRAFRSRPGYVAPGRR